MARPSPPGPTAKPIEIRLLGENLEQLRRAADALRAKLAAYDGVFDVEVLGQVDTSTIPEVLVEEAINLIHETGALPATIAAIAGLPGRITITSIRGKVIPGGTQTQLPEYSIESCTRISRWATAAVRGGGGNKGLDESPLFVSQVHVLEVSIFGLKKMKKKRGTM